mmetsp:Transcript_84970/g.274680  ORF Transcript_84970/g.274680 Transcript_84970/m.274680 type:complete len:508 (-) Transcript_84970:463-1986(-)
MPPRLPGHPRLMARRPACGRGGALLQQWAAAPVATRTALGARARVTAVASKQPGWVSPRSGAWSAPGSSWPPEARRQFVTISSDRLEEFVQAELNFFAECKDRPLQPLPLHEILSIGRTPGEMAKLLHEELPVRFARRIKHIERISDWDGIPELVKLRSMHLKSFRELRLADPVVGADAYPGVVARIRRRHKKIGPLFADALQRIDAVLLGSTVDAMGSVSSLGGACEVGCSDRELRLNRQRIEKWAEAFLSSRVSTEMQMAHYAACLGTSGEIRDSSKIGIIDAECDPFDICQQAMAQVQDGLYPCLVEAENPCGKIRFCQSPRYLFYIVVELLNNAARSTAEVAEQGAQEDVFKRPIRVSVCANELQVVIRISDRGGGMPMSVAESMWSYVSRVGAQRSVAAPPSEWGDNSEEEGPAEPPPSFVERPWAVFTGASPLSGRGIGLPLSRLYAKYLGGSLEVVNMPGLGVDAYLFLPRIDPSEAKSTSSIDDVLLRGHHRGQQPHLH